MGDLSFGDVFCDQTREENQSAHSGVLVRGQKALYLLTFIFLSCSSQERTQYGPYDKEERGGYSQEKFSETLDSVVFQGNRFTKRQDAEAFARFRAIEICHEEGLPLTQIIGVLDKSSEKEVTRSSSNVYGFPSYFYGYSPFWSRYSGVGFSAGINTVSSESWSETLTYPRYEVLFRCVEKVIEPELILREVPAPEMRHLVKDLKGGLQVEKIMKSSPNQKLKLQDIILFAGGERITQNWQLLSAFDAKNIKVSSVILREGERRNIELKGKEVTEETLKSQQETINSVCKFEEVATRSLCKK